MVEKVLNSYSLTSESVVLTLCYIVSPNYLIQVKTYCDHLRLAGRGETGKHRSVGEDAREEGLER